MARNKGTFNFSANFEPLFKAPLDARQLVGSKADLTDPSIWKDADELVWLYNGLIVGVGNDLDPSNNGVYFLKEASTYTNILSWEKLGTGSAIDVSALMSYIDGSLNRLIAMDASLDASINFLFGWELSQDASIKILFGLDASLDASINAIWQYLENPSTGRFVKEASLGTDFYWEAGKLEVSIGAIFPGDISTSHVFYDPALDSSLTMPVAVGGIPAGTSVFDLQGDSLRTILNDLLFPTVAPILNAPSYSFSDNVAAVQEIGASISGTFSDSFNRGSIYNGAVFQNYRSGLPNQYTYTDASSNTLLVDLSTNVLTRNQTVTGYLVKIGTQSFSGKAYYDIGPQPLDNKGNPSGSPLAAGSIGPNSTNFEGVYALYATTVAIATLTKQSLVSMLSGNSIQYTLVAESGGDKQKFEIPTAWTGAPTNRPLVGVMQYNTFAHVWEYPGGSAATSLTLWTTSAVTEGGINYTRYTYNGTDRGSVQIQLMF
jgi:hypothetical protein